jgi:histidinol-phosphate aminotransferase
MASSRSFSPSHSAIADLVTPWAQSLEPYPPGKPIEEVERELGHPAIKLASNENPFGPSPLAVEAAARAMQKASFYPDGGGYYLRQKLAALHRLDMDRIILGAGSTELIELVAKTCLAPGDDVVVSERSFYIYDTATRSMGGRIIKAPMRGLTCDLEAVRAAVTPETKIIYLANPNNPTGTMFTADRFDELLDSLPRRVLVVLDEAYYDYVSAPGYSRSLDEVCAGRNLLLLRTFSKVHGLAGLRIGYGIGSAELIEALNRVRSPFNASGVAQAAAMAALDDHDHLRLSVESNAREMEFLAGEFEARGIRYTPSVANFVLIDTGRDCNEDFRQLLHEGVIVRPMKLYQLATSLRVTVGTHAENQTFLEALDRVAPLTTGWEAVTVKS